MTTSPAAQAVERKNFIDSLDTMIWADDAEQKLRARGDALIAFDARAESRTAEQGAVAPTAWRVDFPAEISLGHERFFGHREQMERSMKFAPGAVAVPLYEAPPTVAAATRAAFEKAKTICLSRLTLGEAYVAIKQLADALPAEAPEGRVTSAWRKGEMRAFTLACNAADATVLKGDPQYEVIWRQAMLFALAASPEAAQPAASEREAFEATIIKYAGSEDLGRHMPKRHGDGYVNANIDGRWDGWQARAALAQATPQAPEGASERIAAMLSALVEMVLIKYAIDIQSDVRQVVRSHAIDAALANKENAE